jgi:hypothetical protein
METYSIINEEEYIELYNFGICGKYGKGKNIF